MLDDFRDNDDLDKGGEFLDEFRQRLNSQPIENIEERKNEINRSQHIFLGTILGIGLAGVVSWFILSPNNPKINDVEIPVIRRPHTAIKVQPADPGGMEILNQDKTVYDIVEKKDSNEVKVENLLPLPEEPKLPPNDQDNLIANTEIKAESSSVIKDAEKIIAAEEKKIQTAGVKEIKAKEEIKVEIKEQPAKTVVEKSTEKSATPKLSENQIEKIEVKLDNVPSIAPAGTWQIQLISSPNKTAMEKAWIDLTKKYSELKNLPHEVESADLGSKGTFYRLKAGAFKNRSEADKLCNSIKSAGGTCLVKKK